MVVSENKAFDLVKDELAYAENNFPVFASKHEGYAILLEEVRELEREVFWGSNEDMIAEAIQVAAMAIRFVKELSSE